MTEIQRRPHDSVLDALSVTGVAAVVGGSLGGTGTLEWPLYTPSDYAKTIIPIITSSYQRARGIVWNETQREAIGADAAFKHGWYKAHPSQQPIHELGAARMMAMLTYRSNQSFENRFHCKRAYTPQFETELARLGHETGLATCSAF